MAVNLVQHMALEKVVEVLREQRIKIDTDYSIINKYGKNVVTCCEVYADTIRAAFIEQGLHIEKLLTFNWDQK